MKKTANIHPGEILDEEFLKPMGISAYRLAKDIGVPLTRIAQILKRNRGISPETALRLSAYFGNTAEFWLGIQMEYDLRQERATRAAALRAIKPYQSAPAALHIAEEAEPYRVSGKRARKNP